MSVLKGNRDSHHKGIKIVLKSNDHRIVDKSVKDVVEAAKKTWATVSGPIPGKTKVHKITVHRSPIRHSKAREQYRQSVHKRILYIHFTSSQTMDALREVSIPDGIDISLYQLV